MGVQQQVVAAVAGMLVGAAVAAAGGASVSNSDARSDLAALTLTASRIGDGYGAPTLPELLRHVGPARDAWLYQVVVARVTAVEKEAGYGELFLPDAPSEGRPGAQVIAFDDPHADWRTLRLTLAVDETLAGQHRSTLQLSWPLMGSSNRGDDAAAVRRALRSLGRLVVFVQTNPPRPEFLGITRQVYYPHRGVLAVDGDGSVRPLFADGREAPGADCCPYDAVAFLSRIDTLAEVRSELARLR